MIGETQIPAREHEILAPAGSFESLAAAIQAGCDAVYFGVTQLNMRARAASNFDLDDLGQIAAQCQTAGVRSYLALNSLLYPHDIRMMQRILKTAQEFGVHAVIAADVATIESAAMIGLPVHISTQLSVANLESLRFWSRYADTVVLARELTLAMIDRIHQGIVAEDIRGPSGHLIRIEVFAHGALCIAVSGRCGMSLYTDNASANRGACIQNCRKSYIVTDAETGMQLEIDNDYIMSPKDICTIDFLDRLLASGVSVFKIEGRGRGPEYVSEVIACYREGLEAVRTKTYTAQKIQDWRYRLENVYNRGLSDGYYLGMQQGWSQNPHNQARTEKVFVGQVLHYYPRAGIMQISLNAMPLELDQEIIITGPTTGLVRTTIQNLRSVEDQDLRQAPKGSLVTVPVPSKVRLHDKVYLIRGHEHKR
ncbi:MAG: U32 family peptidase [Leptospiraceae bacterium]|nr:U32 family peptidase [Leptospiraceae bacterium]